VHVFTPSKSDYLSVKAFFHDQKPRFGKNLLKKFKFFGGLTKVGELGKYIFRSQHDQITQEN
jgi:hypothetical protein